MTKQSAIVLVCSFCLKPDSEVATLIAGPGVCICDECVTLCQKVMETKAESVRLLAPWERIGNVDVVLTNLPESPRRVRRSR